MLASLPMTVTRLKRKDRKNLARAVNKTQVIKHLLARPVIKQVNMDELTAKYGSGAATPAVASTNHKQESQEQENATPLMSAGDMNA